MGLVEAWAQDGAGSDPASRWQTSMILGRGLEARLREARDAHAGAGALPPIAVDIEARPSSDNETVNVEIPPVSHPRWLELLKQAAVHLSIVDA